MAQTIVIYVSNILFLLIILISTAMQKGQNGLSAQRFRLLVLSIILMLSVDFTSECLEGFPHPDIVFVMNLLSYFVVDLIVYNFSRYFLTLLEGEKDTNTTMVTAAISFTVVRVIVTMGLCVTGHLFSIVDGHYVEEDLSFIPYIISAVIMFLMLIAAAQNRKHFTKRAFVVIILYLVVPIIPILVEMIINLYCLIDVSISLSVTLIYALIQNSAIEQGRLRETVLEEISYNDLLTGLKNRRAFYDATTALSPNTHVGIIFCDVNGLKYTNDHFGHAAGDQLLISFAELLKESFHSYKTFRISGDEFVVLMEGMTQSIFDQKVKDFKAIMAENDGIAAVGSSFGAGACIERLTSEAEENMYQDKNAYHQKQATSFVQQ